MLATKIVCLTLLRYIVEVLITPEQFAQVLCEDLDLHAGTFASAISQSIRQQVEQFSPDVIPQDEEDRRVIIKVRYQTPSN